MLDAAVIDQLAKKMRRYRGLSPNEQHTKSTLVDPLVEALHWHLRDSEGVERKSRYRDRRPSYHVGYVRNGTRLVVLLFQPALEFLGRRPPRCDRGACVATANAETT